MFCSGQGEAVAEQLADAHAGADLFPYVLLASGRHDALHLAPEHLLGKAVVEVPGDHVGGALQPFEQLQLEGALFLF